jgi:hypothetical protein
VTIIGPNPYDLVLTNGWSRVPEAIDLFQITVDDAVRGDLKCKSQCGHLKLSANQFHFQSHHNQLQPSSHSHSIHINHFEPSDH